MWLKQSEEKRLKAKLFSGSGKSCETQRVMLSSGGRVFF